MEDRKGSSSARAGPPKASTAARTALARAAAGRCRSRPWPRQLAYVCRRAGSQGTPPLTGPPPWGQRVPAAGSLCGQRGAGRLGEQAALWLCSRSRRGDDLTAGEPCAQAVSRPAARAMAAPQAAGELGPMRDAGVRGLLSSAACGACTHKQTAARAAYLEERAQQAQRLLELSVRLAPIAPQAQACRARPCSELWPGWSRA